MKKHTIDLRSLAFGGLAATGLLGLSVSAVHAGSGTPLERPWAFSEEAELEAKCGGDNKGDKAASCGADKKGDKAAACGADKAEKKGDKADCDKGEKEGTCGEGTCG